MSSPTKPATPVPMDIGKKGRKMRLTLLSGNADDTHRPSRFSRRPCSAPGAVNAHLVQS